MVHVLLGYIKEKGEKNELHNKEKINKKFISKVGGKPFWLDRVNVHPEKDFHCVICNNLMSFLLQIYAPIENVGNCFHRCIYLFICLPCGNQIKCFRTQLPRNNPFYNYNLEGAEETSSSDGDLPVKGTSPQNTSEHKSEPTSEYTSGEDLEPMSQTNDDDKTTEGYSMEGNLTHSSVHLHSENFSTEINVMLCKTKEMNILNQSNGATTAYESNGDGTPYQSNGITIAHEPNDSTAGGFLAPGNGAEECNNQKIESSSTEDATRLLDKMVTKKNANYLTLLIQEDKNKFDPEMEYLFCCKFCGIPCEDKSGKHKKCIQKKHAIFQEKKIYISDEEDCEESSVGSRSSSDEDIENRENHESCDTMGEKHTIEIKLNHNKENVRDEVVGDVKEDELDDSEMKAFEEIQKDVLSIRKIDKIFLRYLTKIQRFPNQFIRYSYKGQVLLSSNIIQNCNRNNIYERDNDCNSDDGQRKTSSSSNVSSITNTPIECCKGTLPPHCHICKKAKVFEFQVLSTVINFLRIKKNLHADQNLISNLKFSYIAVYTCENNCDMYDINNVRERQMRGVTTSRYIQEYASVQAE
ncbi:hypothetical protein, conserved [Plasmodium gonderi]|uniref:Programmed cell death protein 2 C-terminal domain-containing protein n=1 Tax=Plasmodium gonderi TaxID=77519 RepID=A0A1Y1JEZ3_PLAGO|nr:hypothetical protein, conserved [Plasmodium gonderi]GAW79302.1 hypothetical protein, conserved [Plasmodium gonderi]